MPPGPRLWTHPCDRAIRLALAAVAIATAAAAQPAPTPTTAQVSGTITDSLGTPVSGVRIALVGTPRTAFSTAAGQYRFREVPAGRVTLRFSRIGFTPALVTEITVAAGTDVVRNVVLQRAPPSLSQVTITPGAFSLLDASASSRLALSRDALLTAPQPAEDIFRSLNRLPGLSGSDFSSRVRIRNGGADEQLYTLDGIELLEPFHLKDFDGALSIVDGEVLGGIAVTTGGFGVSKGNRMAGVIDMVSSMPSPERSRTAIGLSLSNMRARSEGSFGDGRGGWMLSARRGYLDLLFKVINLENPPDPRYGDVFSKVQYDVTPSHQLTVHGLLGTDVVTLSDPDGSRLRSRYGNQYAWSTLRSRFGTHAAAVTLLSFTRLTWQRDLLDTQGFNNQRFTRAAIDDRRTLDAITLKQDWTVDMTTLTSLTFGGEYRSEGADYRYQRTQVQRTLVARVPVALDSVTVRAAVAPEGIRASAYAAVRVRPVTTLLVEAGARTDRHTWTQQTTVSPRVNASWTPRAGTSVRGAWGWFHQAHALQELSIMDGDTAFARAERAEHRVLGIEQDAGGGWTARAEVYERLVTSPRARFFNADGVTTSPLPEAELDRVRIAPSQARVRGVELLAQYDHGGHIRAGGSLVLSQATAIVNGREEIRPFDEPWAATADLAYRASNGWTFAAAFSARAGWPIGTPSFRVDTVGPGRVAPRRLPATPRFDRRLSPYVRVDARATRTWRTSRGAISTWLDLFNLLNRRNERAFEYRFALASSPTRVTVTPTRLEYLTLLPSVGVTWAF